MYTGMKRKRKKNAAHAFYFSMQALVQALISSSEDVAANLAYHDKHRAQCHHEQAHLPFDKRIMHDLHCSTNWQERFINAQIADGGYNPMNLAFVMSCDGVSPFKFSQYTMWPVTIMLMNLPHHMRVKHENMLIPAIIPGPKQPWDLDSFLQPLRDELAVMRQGFKVDLRNGQQQRPAAGVDPSAAPAGGGCSSPSSSESVVDLRAYLLFTPLDIKAHVKV